MRKNIYVVAFSLVVMAFMTTSVIAKKSDLTSKIKEEVKKFQSEEKKVLKMETKEVKKVDINKLKKDSKK